MKFLSTTSLAAAALVLLTVDAAKYKQCTESERQSVFGGLTNELKTCATVSTFDLTSSTLPTSAQRQAVCKCTDLIKRLADLSLPRCNLVLDGSALSFKEAVSSVFTACGIAELKEVPATPAPAGTNSTDSAADDSAADDTVASEASLPSSASKASSSSSDLEVETPAPTKKPSTPTPTAADSTAGSNSTAKTVAPTPTPASGAVSAVTSISLSVVVALAAYVAL